MSRQKEADEKCEREMRETHIREHYAEIEDLPSYKIIFSTFGEELDEANLKILCERLIVYMNQEGNQNITMPHVVHRKKQPKYDWLQNYYPQFEEMMKCTEWITCTKDSSDQ